MEIVPMTVDIIVPIRILYTRPTINYFVSILYGEAYPHRVTSQLFNIPSPIFNAPEEEIS